jgi:hypothetical protein
LFSGSHEKPLGQFTAPSVKVMPRELNTEVRRRQASRSAAAMIRYWLGKP